MTATPPTFSIGRRFVISRTGDNIEWEIVSEILTDACGVNFVWVKAVRRLAGPGCLPGKCPCPIRDIPLSFLK
jgi:hypothetical protein